VAALDQAEKVWYLRQTGLFDRLSESDLRRLAALSHMREYPRGQSIILGSEPDPDLIYLVKAGRVKILAISPEGKQQILAILERGDVFGELAPAGPVVPTHVEAFDHTVVCTLHRTLFEDVIRRTPEVALRVIAVLARRLRATEQEIEDLALRDVPGRLAALLLRLAEEYGEPHGAGIRLSLRLTHQDLASMVGSTRETITALVNRFRDEGLLTVEQRILIILQQERLREIAHTHSRASR
jgi:CRP/FNR family transcriptional regulator, cyclic AMP receptor protein